MIKYGILKRFLVIWTLYWLANLLQPVHSIYPNIHLAVLLQFVFVFVVTVFYVVMWHILNLKNPQIDQVMERFESKSLENLIQLGFFAGALGLVFLLYDKVMYQGIDYTKGLALAREKWEVVSQQRNHGISSTFSVLGYLIGGAYFFPLSISLCGFFAIKDSRRLLYICIGCFLLLAHSLITGGRSSIILAVSLSTFGYFDSKKFGTLFKNKFFNKYLRVILLVIFFYLIYVFYSRANKGGVNAAQYGIEFLEYLGLKPYGWFETFCATTPFGGLFSLLNLTLSYLAHSLASTAAIIYNDGFGGGDAVFAYFYSLGFKIGLTNPPVEWFLAGRFPSLPGAIYMQFGVVGILLMACILGVFSAVSVRWFSAHPRSFFLFGLCATMESILVLSPFLFAGDLLFFPFAILGGLFLINIRVIAQRIKHE